MNKNVKSKALRILLYFILFFVGFTVIIWILMNVYFNKKIIEYVKERVSESSNGKYVLSLDGLSMNPWTRSITVDNLIIAPSKNVFHPKAQYVFKTKSLKIINFSISSYFSDNDLIVERVECDEPQISIFQGLEQFHNKKNDSLLSTFSLYSTFSKTLNSISVGQIDIMNSKFNIYKNGIDTSAVFSSADISISIKNFIVNEETDKQNKLFSAEKFEAVMNKFSYQLGDGLYMLYGKRLHASFKDSTLIVDSLQLIPNFDKKEFAEEAGRQISRINVIAAQVSCQKIDVQLFFEYNWLVINKVNLLGCNIKIHRDNTLPLAPIVRESPQAMLKSLPFFVAIDTIEMKEGEITYEERNANQPSTGKVIINKLNGIITGMYNDTLSYSDKSSINIEVSADFMNEGKFTGRYAFPLSSTKEYFIASGTLNSMSMVSFNSVIPASKNLKFTSGYLKSANFSYVANDDFSTGTMEFIYNDLKVEVINKGAEKPKLVDKVKTFFANELIVLDSNPGKSGIVRVSPIYVEHNRYRYFIFYSMQSILSGINSSIKDEKNAKLLSRKK